MSTAPDELFPVKNHFWLGNYQRAIHEGSTFRTSNQDIKTSCDSYVLRSYVALGKYETVFEEIANKGSSVSTGLKAIGLHAKYLQQPSSREKVIETIKDWLTDVATANDATLQLTASVLFQVEGDYKSALKVIRRASGLEQMAMLVQIYLKMNQLELAHKQLKAMQKIDDDNTLTQLCLAWVNMSIGGSKYQDAVYVYQELIDKYGSTVSLLNGFAVAQMHLGNYEEAHESLVDALSKDDSNADTLVNVCTCLQFLQKPIDTMQRYIRDLRKSHPSNQWLKEYDAINSAFNEASAK